MALLRRTATPIMNDDSGCRKKITLRYERWLWEFQIWMVKRYDEYYINKRIRSVCRCERFKLDRLSKTLNRKIKVYVQNFATWRKSTVSWIRNNLFTYVYLRKPLVEWIFINRMKMFLPNCGVCRCTSNGITVTKITNFRCRRSGKRVWTPNRKN